MKQIITIQHPQSEHHINNMIGSWTDWSLSEKGKHQAGLIGERLARELSGKDFVVYCSDLLRTRQTAEIVCSYLDKPFVLRQQLRERNLGEAVGKSEEWAHKNSKGVEHDIDNRPFANAETRRETWDRIYEFYEEIRDSSESLVIIIGHGDSLSLFNAMWIELSSDDLNHCDLFGFAGGVSFLYEDKNDRRIIRRLSDMSYIAEW